MATEIDLWKWLKKSIPVYTNDLHLTRIENLAGVGVADVEGCLRGKQFWIELKIASKPGGKVRFQKTQPPWHKRRLLAGGKTFVLVQAGQDRYLIPGEHIPSMEAGVDWSKLSVVDPKATCIDIIEKVGEGG